MIVDPTLHTFHSPGFQRIVKEVITFLLATSVHELPPQSQFIGSGVYTLYYIGKYRPYTKIANLNRSKFKQPIYIGKAVPPGWRTARVADSETPDLFRRLREHTRSLQQTTNLQIKEFRCRFVILGG